MDNTSDHKTLVTDIWSQDIWPQNFGHKTFGPNKTGRKTFS